MWIIATPAGHQMNQLSYKANVPKLLSHPLSIALAKKSSTSLALINSVRQDIIYRLSGAKKEQKGKTGSKDILTLLNRLGHCGS